MRWRTGVVILVAFVVAGCGATAPGRPAANVGTVESRVVPASILDLPLTDQNGHSVDLASYRSKVLVIVPFLTLCTDICPLDTGNLLQVTTALRRSAAASRVQLMELSVDPVRDTPARLHAYAQLTGATWKLVTETPAEATTLEDFFGWVVQKVAEDKPPSIDWWTGKPLTYDINHSDGFVVVTDGKERFSTGAAPNFHGRITPKLFHFLDDEGFYHLDHPAPGSWTPTSMVQVLSWTLGKPIT